MPNTEFAQLVFKDSSMIEIRDSRPMRTAAAFMSLQGKSTQDIILMNNNFKKLNRIVEVDKDVKKTEVKEINNIKMFRIMFSESSRPILQAFSNEPA